MPGKARPSVCENILKEINLWTGMSEPKRKAVIELCERAIPQKVIPNGFKPKYNWDAFCPNCGARVMNYCNYCSECGKRLDWGFGYDDRECHGQGEEVKGGL